MNVKPCSTKNEITPISYMLIFKNAKTVDLYINRVFIRKLEYYNNYYGNITIQSSFIITNQYLPPDEAQNVDVPCITYNIKLLHFIKAIVLKEKNHMIIKYMSVQI